MEKAASPNFAQILALLASYGLLQADNNYQEDQVAEASLQDQATREFESMRMRPVTNSLKYASDAVAEVGKSMARDSLAKEAWVPGLIGMAGRGLGGAMKGTGRALGSLGRSGNTFRFEQAAHRAGVGATPSAAMGGLKTPLPTTGTQRLNAAMPGGIPGSAPTPGTTGVRGALRRAGVGLQSAGNRLSGNSTKFQQNAVIGKPGAPWISGGTKAKLLGAGAVLGAGYVGMKGLQATRDYMMHPTGVHAFGQPSAAPRAGITEYGY